MNVFLEPSPGPGVQVLLTLVISCIQCGLLISANQVEPLPTPEAIKIVVRNEDLILPKILTRNVVSSTTTARVPSHDTLDDAASPGGFVRKVPNQIPSSSLKTPPKRRKKKFKGSISKVERVSKHQVLESTPSTTFASEMRRTRFPPKIAESRGDQTLPSGERANVVEITEATNSTVHLVYPVNSDGYLSTVPNALPGINFAQLENYEARREHSNANGVQDTTQSPVLSTLSGYLDQSTLGQGHGDWSTTIESTTLTSSRKGIPDDSTTTSTSAGNSGVIDPSEASPTTESGPVMTGNRFTTRANPERPQPHLFQNIHPTVTPYGLKISTTEMIDRDQVEEKALTATFRPSTAISMTSRPSYHVSRSSSASPPSSTTEQRLVEDTAIFDPALSDLEFQSAKIEKERDDDNDGNDHHLHGPTLELNADESEISSPISIQPPTTTDGIKRPVKSRESVEPTTRSSLQKPTGDDDDNDDGADDHKNNGHIQDLKGFKRHETNRQIMAGSPSDRKGAKMPHVIRGQPNLLATQSEDDDEMKKWRQDWGESIIRNVHANQKAHNDSTMKRKRGDRIATPPEMTASKTTLIPSHRTHPYRVHNEKLKTTGQSSASASHRLLRQLSTLVPPTDYIQRAVPLAYDPRKGTKSVEQEDPLAQSGAQVRRQPLFNGHGIVPTKIARAWSSPTIPPLRTKQLNAHNYFQVKSTTIDDLQEEVIDPKAPSEVEQPIVLEDQQFEDSISKYTYTFLPTNPPATATSTMSPLVAVTSQTATSSDGLYHPEQHSSLVDPLKFGNKLPTDNEVIQGMASSTQRITTFRPNYDHLGLQSVVRSHHVSPPRSTPSTIVSDVPHRTKPRYNLFHHPTRLPNLVTEPKLRRYSYKTVNQPGRDADPPKVRARYPQRKNHFAKIFPLPPRPEVSRLPGLRPDPDQHQPPFPLPHPIRRPSQDPAQGANGSNSAFGTSWARGSHKGVGTDKNLPQASSSSDTVARSEGSDREEGKKQRAGSTGGVTRAADGYTIDSPHLFLEVDFPTSGQREAHISGGYARESHNPKRRRQKLVTIPTKTPNPIIDKLRDFSIPNFNRFDTSLKSSDFPKKDSLEPDSIANNVRRIEFQPGNRQRLDDNVLPTDWSKPLRPIPSLPARTSTPIMSTRRFPYPRPTGFKGLRSSVNTRVPSTGRTKATEPTEPVKRYTFKVLDPPRELDPVEEEALPTLSRDLKDIQDFIRDVPKQTVSLGQRDPTTTHLPAPSVSLPFEFTKTPTPSQFATNLLKSENIRGATLSAKTTPLTPWDDVEDDDDLILVGDPGQRGFVELKREKVVSGVPFYNRKANPFLRPPNRRQPLTSPHLPPPFPSYFAVPSTVADREPHSPIPTNPFSSERQPSDLSPTQEGSGVEPRAWSHADGILVNDQKAEGNQVDQRPPTASLKAKTRYEPIDITEFEPPSPKIGKRPKPKNPNYIPSSRKKPRPTKQPYVKRYPSHIPTFTLPSMTPNILRLDFQAKQRSALSRIRPSRQPQLGNPRFDPQPSEFPRDMPNPFRSEIGSIREFDLESRPQSVSKSPPPPTPRPTPVLRENSYPDPPTPLSRPTPRVPITSKPEPRVEEVTARGDTGNSIDYDYEGGLGGEPVPTTLLANDLTVMAGLLSEGGMDVRLSGPGPYTLFAPTDSAFNRFLNEYDQGGVSAALEKLKSNRPELIRIMQNHIVKGLVLGRDLEDDLVGTSLSGSKLRSNLYLSENHEWKDVLVKTINGGIIKSTDLEASNGVVHIIDRVLFPPATENIIQTLKADPEGRFTTLLKALKATKLDKEISDFSTGPWTIFAPTNEAFMNLPMKDLENLIQDPKQLNRLVLNHLINRSIFSAGLRPHQVIEMANGNKLNLFSRKDRLKLDGANVSDMDITAANGVIQVVENVIELKENKRHIHLTSPSKTKLFQAPKEPKLFKFR